MNNKSIYKKNGNKTREFDEKKIYDYGSIVDLLIEIKYIK